MKDHPDRLPVADQIRKGLEEAIQYIHGEITLKTTTLEHPDPPPTVGHGPLFERLKKGLEEAIAHANGEITLKTTLLELPDPPPEIKPSDLAKLRSDHHMSQTLFARLLNVSPRTVQTWEQGTRKPSQAALRLLQLFRHDPDTLLRIAGMTPGQTAKTGAKSHFP
jgi:putative transcriptional regulator